jgi:hypothetical protein
MLLARGKHNVAGKRSRVASGRNISGHNVAGKRSRVASGRSISGHTPCLPLNTRGRGKTEGLWHAADSGVGVPEEVPVATHHALP